MTLREVFHQGPHIEFGGPQCRPPKGPDIRHRASARGSCPSFLIVAPLLLTASHTTNGYITPSHQRDNKGTPQGHSITLASL